MPKISNKLKLISILSASPAFTYIIGAMWLNEYYKNFNIDFFKYSSPSGVVLSLFSNMETLINVSIIGGVFIAFTVFLSVILVFLIRGVLVRFFKVEDKGKHMDILFSMLIIVGLLSLIACFHIADFVANNKANEINRLFEKNEYFPVDVYFDNLDDKKIKCLSMLGVVGEYKAFLNDEETILIKESEIKRIDVKLMNSCN